MQDSSFCVSRTHLLAGHFFLSCVSCVHWSEVWEATGIFFVLRGDEESRVFKFIVAKFLKGDSCCDGREDGDVELDWKPGRKLHLDKLSEFVEVLERGYDLQHV